MAATYEYRSFGDLIVDDEKKIIEGYAIVFGQKTKLYTDEFNNDYYEVIDRSALNNCDLSDVFMKYNHDDSSQILGRIRNKSLELKVDEKGLYFRAVLPDTNYANDIYNLVKTGYLNGTSFGFKVDQDTYDRETRTRTINAIKFVKEISIVDTPAYEGAYVQCRDYFSAQAELIKKEQQDEKRKCLLLRTYF